MLEFWAPEIREGTREWASHGVEARQEPGIEGLTRRRRVPGFKGKLVRLPKGTPDRMAGSSARWRVLYARRRSTQRG